MDDLISRAKLLKDSVWLCGGNITESYANGYMDGLDAVEKAIRALPAVEAVPLDKLCEWLAGNAWHLDCSDCDGEHCDCPQLHDDSGSSPAFWKAKLTKWIEGLYAAN